MSLDHLRDFKNWMPSVLLAGCFLMASASADLAVHPGLELVESNDGPSSIHRLITSRVKRVSGNVRPESSEFVRGSKSMVTYQIPSAYNTDEVIAFYQEQLSQKGQTLFECQGRACGPSNYWSNQVFREPWLYGPLEYQHYMLAKLDSGDVDYVVLYFSQRGTGQRYLYQESYSGVDEGVTADGRLIASMLRLQRRFVFDANNEMLAAIRDVINANSDLMLAIVAHSPPLKTESLDESIDASASRASDLKRRLTEMGADTSKLQALGAGPMAPISRINSERYELVKLN